MPSQETFFTCYRGNQGVWHHAAYMRMSKVLLLRVLLSRHKLESAEKDILDYGFGAGTFFRYCPKSSRLFGLELDPVNVAEVTAMLGRRGFEQVNLQAMTIENWAQHPLLDRKYDVIVCSHVIEHLPEPAVFLERMGRCLKPGGVFLGLVPINERSMDPHHVQTMSRAKLEAWAGAAQLRLIDWFESDHWLYWLQPLFTRERGGRHKCAQVISLGVGVIACGVGANVWFKLSRWFGALSCSQPTQAAFVLRGDRLMATE